MKKFAQVSDKDAWVLGRGQISDWMDLSSTPVTNGKEAS